MPPDRIADDEPLNPHAKSPQAIKDEYKRHQKGGEHVGPQMISTDQQQQSDPGLHYEVKDIPGLVVYTSFLSSQSQLFLLDKLFHRDLLNPEHKTNVHMHYHIPNPPQGQSFFTHNDVFTPIDPSCHKPLTARQFLDKKLRWMTLGGQYDWTNKVYPSETPPPFPGDIKQIIETAFPMKAEAAIVNLYSPGDTLSLHRDVSEDCNQPLVSLSIGCECIFIVGLEDEKGGSKTATLRLKSGDAVLMSGESRDNVTTTRLQRRR
ncbi:hypothetical protein AMS68_007843 [Peltaster fructicola]|uniref:Alpha-ketoglutarate-dependent dioxygenase AlkB-like domain-containing protein n=1 Tax=Peltaster fructicola TaxID=286661 RepID=A0A6H0Y5S7_9PEZI|nr:hypothetical protein AMS68_007843 [Peltaster fructicola]